MHKLPIHLPVDVDGLMYKQQEILPGTLQQHDLVIDVHDGSYGHVEMIHNLTSVAVKHGCVVEAMVSIKRLRKLVPTVLNWPQFIN